ncbi:MAG: hypothetical protein H0U42_04645 [Thermoleophilaceae bacterium]|nr:hypothetical protein [Thermoleophilaceae bacterium]
MARRSLRPQLNQIRTWVRQGRTDAWIAHQLEVTVRDIDQFKREHGLTADESSNGFEERDLRAEDDELVAAELDAIVEEEAEEDDASDSDDGDSGEAEGDDQPKRRRRGRRGGRRRKGKQPLEGSFDHGDEGYGLWLDASIQDDAIYAEHWAGHRPVVVAVEADRIVITRAGEEPEDGGDADSDD